MGREGRTFALAVLAGLVAGLGAAGVFLALRIHPPANSVVEAAIGGTRLRLDPAFTRFDDQRNGGRLERLDLAFLFPDLRPAGRLADRDWKSEPGYRNEHLVFLTIVPQDDTVDPADRPVKLYARFLEQTSSTGHNGLELRRFEPDSPYENEELYIAPPEGRLFSARCTQLSPSSNGLPNTCIYEFRLRGLDVQMRFSPTRLADWEALSEQAHGLVAGATR